MRSLFNGFSAGLGLEEIYPGKHNTLCWPSGLGSMGTDRLGPELDSGTSTGPGRMMAGAVCHRAKESRSASRAYWGATL